MEVNYQGKTYNLSRNKYKKFRRRCESRKFTPEQNHIWLSKMEEIFKGNNLEGNPGMKKNLIHKYSIFHFIICFYSYNSIDI